MYLFYLAIFLILYCYFKSNYKFKLIPYEFKSSDKRYLEQKLITDVDKYMDTFSKYDFQSKLKTMNVNLHTKHSYIRKTLNNCIEWSLEERNLLQTYYNEIMYKLQKLGLYDRWVLTMPEIYIIKNKMHHEGGANGYTFRNCIFLKKISYKLLTHELFHIYTRYNSHKKDKLYRLLGFKIADELKLPESIKDLIISNPDTPSVVYTTININGMKFIGTPICHTTKLKTTDTINYSFFNTMKSSVLFVNLRKRNDTIILTPKSMEEYNLPNIMSISDLPNYQKQIEQNTKYNLHPEEVLADNFSLILSDIWKNQTNKELPRQMIEIIKK